MTDLVRGERLYQEFIDFRDNFLTTAMKEASAHSTNAHGQKFRPVVVVPKNRAKYWMAQCERWEEYANELRKYPELGIEKSLYEPGPKYITGATSVRCYDLPATNVGKVKREDILRDITTLMNRVAAAKNTNEYLEQLRSEYAMIEALPPKTVLRTRAFGYTDLVCNYTTLDNPKGMLRATKSGLFFDERTMRYGFEFGSKYKTARPSVYDHIKPLPLAIYPNMHVYVLEEVEKLRAEMKEAREQSSQETKREQWRRAAQKRRQKVAGEKALLKGAEHSAGEQNPTGSDQE